VNWPNAASLIALNRPPAAVPRPLTPVVHVPGAVRILTIPIAISSISLTG